MLLVHRASQDYINVIIRAKQTDSKYRQRHLKDTGRSDRGTHRYTDTYRQPDRLKHQLMLLIHRTKKNYINVINGAEYTVRHINTSAHRQKDTHTLPDRWTDKPISNIACNCY